MAALDDIRAALKVALATVSGLEAYSYVPPQVNPPAAVVAPDSIQYDADFEHGATYTIPVQILVSLGDWESAQRELDAIASPDGTAVQAINSAVDVEARVVSMSEYQLVTYGLKDYFGCVLTVSVLT